MEGLEGGSESTERFRIRLVVHGYANYRFQPVAPRFRFHFYLGMQEGLGQN